MKLDEKKVLKDLGLCARCRQCRMVCEVPIATTMLPICPAGEYFKWDTYYATGRITLAKKILLGKIDYDETIARSVYTCAQCGSCLKQCPILKFNPMEATAILRQIAVEDGIADKVYCMPDTTPIQIESDAASGCETALFVGSVAQSDGATVAKISKALKAAGVEHSLCAGLDAGEYLLRKGDVDAFEAKKAENIAAFQAAGIKKLIAHDPLTHYVLKTRYNLGSVGIDLVFYLSLLEGKVKGETKAEKTTLHDNSYLGRMQGVYDLPRNILQGLGYQTVEMVRTKENAYSCAAYPDCPKDMAENAASIILGDAEQAGAELLVTVGRNDAAQLAATAAQLNSPVKVCDISDLF
ncbi:MAG: (Fe-S)-binding protein [Firmicutes bacterium]|nr:(Fe-S)-binding protein [Bacillota bacterium]